MTEILQNALAIGLCAAAVCYLGWRSWRALAGSLGGKSCGGCGGCSSHAPGAPQVKPLTFIEPPSTQAPPRR